MHRLCTDSGQIGYSFQGNLGSFFIHSLAIFAVQYVPDPILI